MVSITWKCQHCGAHGAAVEKSCAEVRRIAEKGYRLHVILKHPLIAVLCLSKIPVPSTALSHPKKA